MRKIFFSFFLFVLAGLVGAIAKALPVELHAADGWTIAASYLPAQPQQKTILLLHDIAKSSSDFTAFSEKLAAKGIGFLALDLRGHGKSTNKGNYRGFAKNGVDNDYNKMTRDVNAAMEFLKGKRIAESDIMFVGAGMGANVAAKAGSLWPGVLGIALLSPVTNFRDVLPIPALRVYQGYVFIACAADDKKLFLEASMMRNVAFLTSGAGRVTFATAYDKEGHELLDAWAWSELLQWIQTPQKPQLLPDISVEEEDPYDGSYEEIAPSATEEALIPSVLE